MPKTGCKRTLLLTAVLIPLLFLALLSLDPDLSSAGDKAVAFRGNVKSKKFHQPDCRYYNCKNCLEKFATRTKAIKAGYKPCKVCKP